MRSGTQGLSDTRVWLGSRCWVGAYRGRLSVDPSHENRAVRHRTKQAGQCLRSGARGVQESEFPRDVARLPSVCRAKDEPGSERVAAKQRAEEGRGDSRRQASSAHPLIEKGGSEDVLSAS